MTRLPHLLRKYKEVYRRFVATEHELADLDRQIATASGGSPTRQRRVASAPVEPRAQRGVVSDAIIAVLRVLRESKEPLPPREIAARLGIKAIVASQRITRGVKLGYIVRAGNARYRVAEEVPNL